MIDLWIFVSAVLVGRFGFWLRNVCVKFLYGRQYELCGAVDLEHIKFGLVQSTSKILGKKKLI